MDLVFGLVTVQKSFYTWVVSSATLVVGGCQYLESAVFLDSTYAAITKIVSLAILRRGLHAYTQAYTTIHRSSDGSLWVR